MIRIDFKVPNRICTYTDADGRTVEGFLIHDSQEIEFQEKLLELECTNISFSDYDFDKWEEKARTETQKLIDEYTPREKPKFKSEIWRALRRYITFLFYDKCAYCEASIEVGAATQVEHYRPKSMYYWLAYNPDNFVPACAWCNGRKSNHFPLESEERRAKNPSDAIENEHPLLLHPSLQPPESHLEFIAWTDEAPGGRVKPLSKEGEETIKLLGLNRIELFELRRKEQEEARQEFSKALGFGPNSLKQYREKLEQGKTIYSAAKLAQILADLRTAGFKL